MAGAITNPGPEAPGAIKRGAADVKAAQGLARKKQLAQAVALLERVAANHPAAVHDCNLALAYLRAGALTRAQLMWDVSRQRGQAPPDWCDSSLAGQLAGALRAKGYVPLTLVVSPAGAEVEVAGIRLRDLGLVWVPAGTYTVVARAPGLVEASTSLVVSPPSARAALTLEPPRPPADAAVEPIAPVDAGVTADAPVEVVDAAVEVDPPPPPPPPPAAAKWPTFAGIGVGGAGLGLAVAFHTRALSTKRRANDLVAGSEPFNDARDRFGTERAVALGGYAVSAAAFGFATWWWLRRDRGEPDFTMALGPSDRGHGAMLTIGGVLP